MNIHQLSVSYQVDHDRILVQVNTLDSEEMRLWLTRRLVLNFLPHLNRLVINVEASSMQLASQDDLAKKMVMEFKKQESITQADFKTPFKPQASIYPVGKEPLLVTSIQLAPDGKGALRIGFEEKTMGAVAPRGFHMTMASTLLHGFTHLLEAAIRVSEWGILEPQKLAVEALDTGTDKPATQDPPTYLN